MRGKVILYNEIRSALRITPAYAGKSSIVGMHIAEL